MNYKYSDGDIVNKEGRIYQVVLMPSGYTFWPIEDGYSVCIYEAYPTFFANLWEKIKSFILNAAQSLKDIKW